jgi:hypothetical protein
MILDWVQGYEIPFHCTPPPSHGCTQLFSKNETNLISQEIEKLKALGAVSECSFTENQFTSPIFLVQKPNGSYRFILNLKKLNQYIDTEHFKLEDIRTACKLMTKDCYMATVDLREAYFSVPISENSKKYLRFKFNGQLYTFNVLPYGLCTAPFVFTKLIRPISTYLRNNNVLLTCYLDDILIFGNSEKTCKDNVTLACNLLQDLGFVINFEKCVLSPNKVCKFLGFILNSANMSLSVPEEKQLALSEKIEFFQKRSRCTIRDFSQLLGSLNSIAPAVPYGWVYTKILEREKYLALLRNNENYNAIMTLPWVILPELDWWCINMNRPNSIKQHKFVLEIHTDASLTGWGAVCKGKKVSGAWSHSEKQNHINFLELKAALLGLKCFSKELNNCEILLRVDNTTALAYINKAGGIQFPHLNNITREIWQYCEERNIWIYASYINTKDNFEADRESRKINIEWELCSKAYRKITNKFGKPEIDLFASRTNAKCDRFISWKCDPEAFTVDAFTISWNNIFFYAFPPFSLVLKSIQKIMTDKATGILVFPYWPSQPWFPLLKKLLIGDPLILEPNVSLLSSPYRKIHPLHQHLTLGAGLLSARHM